MTDTRTIADQGLVDAGRRALVCMKHVGLNVAADAFMNAAVTGVAALYALCVAVLRAIERPGPGRPLGS